MNLLRVSAKKLLFSVAWLLEFIILTGLRPRIFLCVTICSRLFLLPRQKLPTAGANSEKPNQEGCNLDLIWTNLHEFYDNLHFFLSFEILQHNTLTSQAKARNIIPSNKCANRKAEVGGTYEVWFHNSVYHYRKV